MISLTINGEDRQLDVEPDMPLLWALRDVAKVKGPKFGCGIAACGACTVMVDGQARRSCVTPVESVDGAEITTIEGWRRGTRSMRCRRRGSPSRWRNAATASPARS